MFCKKDVLRNFAKFTGKHLRQRLFFSKVASLRRASSGDHVNICVENYNIKSSKGEKLLGIKTDKKLNFNSDIDQICKKQDRN